MSGAKRVKLSKSTTFALVLSASTILPVIERLNKVHTDQSDQVEPLADAKSSLVMGLGVTDLPPGLDGVEPPPPEASADVSGSRSLQ